MKNLRHHAQITGIVALTLLCLGLAAAPASAMGVEFDDGGEMTVSVLDQVSSAFSSAYDTVVAFILDIGSIFAHQDGVGILD